MYGTIVCDRCGKRDPAFQRYYDFYNCGPCEENYQVGLWYEDFLSERGWTDEAHEQFCAIFLKERNQTFADYKAEYEAYRNRDVA